MKIIKVKTDSKNYDIKVKLDPISDEEGKLTHGKLLDNIDRLD